MKKILIIIIMLLFLITENTFAFFNCLAAYEDKNRNWIEEDLYNCRKNRDKYSTYYRDVEHQCPPGSYWDDDYNSCEPEDTNITDNNGDKINIGRENNQNTNEFGLSKMRLDCVNKYGIGTKESKECIKEAIKIKGNGENVYTPTPNNNITSRSSSKVLDDFAKKHCQNMEGHVKFDPVCAKYCKTHSGESFCDGMKKDGYNAFIDMANRIINWAVGILAMIAAAMGFYAGFLYIAAVEDSQQKEKAKGILKNVVIGIFFVLAAWAIVNLVLDTFAKESPNSGGKWGLQDTNGN